jgi:atrazine chlorohydrolase/5-methylthioadenosine/S-adenosylhomocysteine deaminase
MLKAGVTVGLGTDNAILSDSVNPFGDVRTAASAHKGHHETLASSPPRPPST